MTGTEPHAMPPQDTPSLAGGFARLAAFIGGVILLVLFTLFSLGSAFFGAVAVWLVSAIRRRNGQVLSRGPAWLVACVGTLLYLVVLGGLFFRDTGGKFLTEMRAAMDSAQVAQQRSSDSAGKPAEPLPPAVQNVSIAIGASVGAGFIIGIWGSMAWAVAMLLAFGYSGAWLPPAPPRRRAVPYDGP